MLETIETALGGRLGYLAYSTQKRNLAHLLMAEQFHCWMYGEFAPDRGLERMCRYNLLRMRSDIIEVWLYSAVQTAGLIPSSGRGGITAGRLINLAKTKQLVTKETADICQRVIDARNDLHPERQDDLLVQISDDKLSDSDLVISRLESDLRSYLGVDSMESLESDQEWCPYCAAGIFSGQQCPACGDYCA